ncbi:MAG: alpha-2-macroglobulin [Helicobacteraceae bacterium]|nr:alpha-2-macroglobulin [Helicobacteraceae bacterium]
MAWILRGVFGNINWQSPPWLKAIGKGAGCASRKVASRKALSAIAIAGLIAIAGGSYAAYIWYENRPKPIDFAPTEITQASVYFYSPYKTDYSADKVVFNPLAISFSADVAPLDNVGKQVTQGATISPPIEGEWIWTSSERLTFTPSADWQIGQRYKVTLDPKTLIAADYGIDRREYEWTVAPFNYRRSTTELYQNPEKPSEKNAIFEFSFDYPVDAASFERALLMQLQAPDKYKISPKPFKFAVKYDDKKLRAWVRSEFVTFPEVDSYMVLSVAEGVKSSLGGDGTSAAANESLYVPSAYRAIVQNAFLTTVEGEDDEQTQALAISFVDGVDPKAIAREVRAWILPADHPFPNKARTRYFVTDYKWSAEDDITDEILALSQPLKLALGETEGGAQRLVSFKYAGDPNRYVYLTIGKNIVTVGGYKAKDALRYALRIPEFPKALKFAADGSLLSLKGERKIALAARNAAGFRLDIDRVIPSQLHHLLNFGYSHQGSLQEIQFSEYSRDYYVEGFTHLQPLPRTTSGKVIYSSVDLDRYLARSVKEPKGVFLLTLSAWNPDTNATESYGSGGRRLVIVSDLALIAKRAADGSGDLFAQSIKEGTPVEGVKISVIGRNGEPVASAVTDENGRARFNSLSHLERQGKEKSPTMYLAQKDDDSTFLPYGASAVDPFLNYSRFEVGGETDWPDKGKLQAYLFSDRGMYRPGENVHIASVVRALDWSVPFSGIPVVARVYDARGLEFTRREFRLDESGLNEFGFDTAADSPTGNWNIQLSVSPTYRDIKKAGVYLGETIVALREFEPDKTKVDIHLEPASKKGWLKPDELKAIIKAENLFGTPAENRRVASRAVLRPTAFGFKEYSGYSFYDSMTATNLFEFDLEETKTNQKGEASLPLINKEYGRASYQMALFAEVFEQGAGRSVTASVSAIVSPNDYLVGAKPDGDLGFIKKNTQRSLSFIAINPKLEKIKLNDLTLEIQEQKYISVLTLQDSGVYKYQSKLIEVSQGGKPFFIASGETVYKIDASKPGGYKLQVKNKSGDILYKAYYSVAGDANVDRSKERNAELELKLSKAEYKNGEEIELSIVAPYVGSGLITIEKDKVYAFKWFKTTTTSAIQTIKVPGDLVGNGYVNVQFVRDFNSDDIFVSPLSYAVAPFKVSTSDKTAAASIDAPKIVKPAQPIAVKLTTEGRHKAIVFGVDEGILQAAGYNFGNPLNFFFRKKALGVQSLQILDLILPEFSRFERLTSKPGGGDYAADAATKSRQLNPFQRKVEKPVAFWTGIIDIEDQKEFEWKTPDYFNGRLRVMALIVSAGKIGVAQTSVNVRDDFVITPNAPFTAAPGDEFIVTAGLSNNVEDLPEGEAVPIKLALSVNKNLEIIGDREVTLNVAPQRESFASFKVKAAQYLGGAELTFKASYAANGKTYSAQRIATTSIRPLVPLRAASQAKRMASGEESVKSDRDLYDAFAKRNAYFSRSPLILANALTSYLDNYPHYCSEQLVSGALAALIVEPYQKVLGGENAEVKLSRIEGVLQSRQNSRGAIGLWTTTYLGDQYITLYAAHYLIEAKERGKRINSSLLSAINDYMSGVASDGFGSVGDMHSLRMRAYAIYLLTRQKQVTTNYLNATLSAMKLHYAKTYEDDIAALYLAATYKLLKMDKEADALIQKQWDALSRAYTSAWWSRDYHDPLVVNAASVYIIGKHFPEKAADIPPQALENIVLALRQNRYTTHSAAWSALALDVFGSLNPLSEAPLTIEARNSAGQTRNIGKMEGAIVYGSFNGDDREIVFKNEGASAWYTVLQEGYERVLPKEPIKKGLEVYREYTDADGKKAGEITVGDVINVTIRVKALGSAAIGNAAIIDLLPGGFEIVPQTAERQSENGGEEEEYEEEGYDGGQSGYVSPFATSVSNFRLDYSDAREDRVLVYGEVGRETASFSYQIKATNAGTYETAPIFAEAMYDREIQALGLGNGKIVVKPAQ